MTGKTKRGGLDGSSDRMSMFWKGGLKNWCNLWDGERAPVQENYKDLGKDDVRQKKRILKMQIAERWGGDIGPCRDAE